MLSACFGTLRRVARSSFAFPAAIRRKKNSPSDSRAIDGFVTGIRGKDASIHVTLQSEGRQISGCETNRTIAKQLGARLFEPVRLFGRGRWVRDGDGEWTLEQFRIESFEPLQDSSLTDALATLRDIPTEWGDDAYNDLIAGRKGPGSNKNGGH